MTSPSDQEPLITRADYAAKRGEIALRPHEYDGIQEYDQALPHWWLAIFYGAVIFFFGYWIAYYNVESMRSDQDKIEEKLSAIEEAKSKDLEGMLAKLNNETLITEWTADAEAVAHGQQIYATYCTACHGPDLHARLDLGGGQFANLPGLSLKDKEWKYGGEPMDVFRIINDGTPPESTGHNGARMIPWGQTLSPLQVTQLTAFILSENPEEFLAQP